MGIVRENRKDAMQTKPQQKMIHATIKKVTEDIESLSFNTAISQMMIFVNAFTGRRNDSGFIDAQLFGSAQSVRAAHCLRVVDKLSANFGCARRYHRTAVADIR